MNDIQTWRQGKYINHKKYSHMSEDWKIKQEYAERELVRPSAEGNAICTCADPNTAKWIASRLNLASKLEQLTYDYAMGKTDGSEIVTLVKANVE